MPIIKSARCRPRPRISLPSYRGSQKTTATSTSPWFRLKSTSTSARPMSTPAGCAGIAGIRRTTRTRGPLGRLGATMAIGLRWPSARAVGTPGTTRQNTSNKSQWNGCVTDRDQSYDVDAPAPTSQSTQFLAAQDQSCPAAQILPLTYNWSNVNATINSMTAQGATNQTLGLQWGWLSLLQQSPMYAPAEPSGSTYQHIIVLFTDGLNTGDRWYGDFSNQSSQVDTRMKKLCDNIKAGGVTLYTVQIDTDGAGQSAVLPYCASGSSNFFMLTQPSQIAAAFSQIGTSISKLHVAK